MTKVKMKAADTLHITSVQSDSIEPGAQFEISEPEAKQLEQRGLATRQSSAAKAPAPKAKR
jgi:hypothetical protein